MPDQSINLSYSLRPPVGTVVAPVAGSSSRQPLPTDQVTFLFSHPTETPPTVAQYYGAAGIALVEAQRYLNQTLSLWKDAVGDREKDKENMGKVAYGQGRAARMTVGVDKITGQTNVKNSDDSAPSSDDEDAHP